MDNVDTQSDVQAASPKQPPGYLQLPLAKSRRSHRHRSLISPPSREARKEVWAAVLPVLRQRSDSAPRPSKPVFNGDVTPQVEKVTSGPGIHVFVDYSNISIGFSEAVRKVLENTPLRNTPLPLVSFLALARILQGDRHCEKKVLVGSTDDPSVDEARSLGYETSILQRVSARDKATSNYPKTLGKSKSKRLAEQAVDEIIIMKMLESLVDYPPSTIVLATGDGNVAEFGEGFFKAVERCLGRGWHVELFAFDHNLSKSWKTLRNPRFKITLLDSWLAGLMRMIPTTQSQEKRKRKTGDGDRQRYKR